MSKWHDPAISLLGTNLRETLAYKQEHLYKIVHCGIVYNGKQRKGNVLNDQK